MLTFSIILSAFNGSTYLSQQLDSILLQDYDHWHLVVVDDCSSDLTYSIALEYATEIPEYVLKIHLIWELHVPFLPSLYAQIGFYFVIRMMFGSPINYLLSYIINKPNFNSLALLHNFSLSASNSFLSRSPHKLYDFPLYFQQKPPLSFWSLLIKNQVIGCCFVVHKSILHKSKFSFLGFPLFYHDHLIALVAASMGSICYIQDPLLLYRRHGNNLSASVRRNIFVIIFSRFQLFYSFLAYFTLSLLRKLCHV